MTAKSDARVLRPAGRQGVLQLPNSCSGERVGLTPDGPGVAVRRFVGWSLFPRTADRFNFVRLQFDYADMVAHGSSKMGFSR